MDRQAPTDPATDRQAAWELLCQYTQSESLRKHALAVEACMRAYARRFGEGGEDQEKWGVVGLIHDFDYELYPNAPDHPLKGSEILTERGYREDIRRAILGHADYGEILDSLGRLQKPPQRTFMVHGEPRAAESIKQKITEQLHWNVTVPAYLEKVTL